MLHGSGWCVDKGGAAGLEARRTHRVVEEPDICWSCQRDCTITKLLISPTYGKETDTHSQHEESVLLCVCVCFKMGSQECAQHSSLPVNVSLLLCVSFLQMWEFKNHSNQSWTGCVWGKSMLCEQYLNVGTSSVTRLQGGKKTPNTPCDTLNVPDESQKISFNSVS